MVPTLEGGLIAGMDIAWGFISSLELSLQETLSSSFLSNIKPSAYSGVFPNKLANEQGIAYIDKQAASESAFCCDARTSSKRCYEGSTTCFPQRRFYPFLKNSSSERSSL